MPTISSNEENILEDAPDDVAFIARKCCELVTCAVDGDDVARQVAHLGAAAAADVQSGVPISKIHYAVRDGLARGLEQLAAPRLRRAVQSGSQTVQLDDFRDFVDGVNRAVDILSTVTTDITTDYLREFCDAIDEHQVAIRTATSALVSGTLTSAMARECGIEIAESYMVIAVEFSLAGRHRGSATLPATSARPALRRIRARLASRYGADALSWLSAHGGTVLLPTDFVDGFDDLDELAAELAATVRGPVAAVALQAECHMVAVATEQVHQLLDTITVLGYPRRLYRFEEMSLEYQLTRPGPARDTLAALLEPIDPYPELVETLRVHFANDGNRKQTARELFVHPNTVDHRIKRITRLTGVDPSSVAGVWRYRSAFLAREYSEGRRPATAGAIGAWEGRARVRRGN
ncbi:PucR family transcriptional regulator [Nocardia sp. NPDC057227]|uniref:PucR family transcriptional regulator n=1 Tax=Nocardia sp. NPDC057227 TaxID=3346056 RepID=UPI0036451D95